MADAIELGRAVETCLEKVRAARSLADPLVGQVRRDARANDFIVRVHDFLDAFGAVTEAIDALPVRNGEFAVGLSAKDRKDAERLFPTLIDEVEKLAGCQLEIIEGMKAGLAKHGDKMKSVRDARQMFEKFVKRPAQDAKFFDKKG